MASPPPPGGGGKKILGMKPRTAAIAGGAILLGAIAYFWWKRKQTPAATSASASASASSYANQAQLDALQQELDELLTSQGTSASGAAGSSGGSGLTTSPGNGSTQPGGPIQSTPGKPGPPPMPTGVRSTKTGPTSITIAWTRSPGATFYPIRVTYQDKLVRSSGTAGTSATIFGLSPNRTYTVHVKAQGPGGVSSETNGPAVKTAL